MSVVPKSAKDFSDPLYWKKFFEKHEGAFEWYGDYSQLSHVLEKFLKPSDLILQIGCGNSQLGEELYDNGYRNVKNIDTDSKVIKKHKDVNAIKRPELQFECRSGAENGMAYESVNVVLDKGTTDALLPVDYTTENSNLLKSVFDDVERCLVALGRFIIVTLAQRHIIEYVVKHFLPKRRYFVRVQKCEFADENFSMPVFFVIITKLKMPLPLVPSIEFVRQISAKVERVSNCNELVTLIESEQELNWFKHYVSKNSVDEATIQICGHDGRPRYRLTIVDDPDTKSLPTMAAFIVPFGREADWLFSTAKGRRILRKECVKSRIVVIGLFRNQEYSSLENIKSELSALVLKLKPIGCVENKINFLSLGAVDVKKSIAKGKSTINGEWSVEEILKDEKTYRRLIFLNSAGLVQSEVEMIEGKRRGNLKIKSDFLTCDHHRSMLTAINFIGLINNGINSNLEWLTAVKQHSIRFAVLGLGGGLFPRFLYEKLPESIIVAVEFDPDVLVIAQKYFGLPKLNDRFKVVIDDAKNFIRDFSLKKENEKFEAVFVDLAGPMNSDGLSCPPTEFVTYKMLKMMEACLKQNGVLAFNLVTRDKDISNNVKLTICSIFSTVYTITSDEDVNEVLICPKGSSKLGNLNNLNLKNETYKEEWINCHIKELKKLSILAN